MIPITINKKKFKIKTIPELSTKEFIELSKMDKPDVIRYIEWQTGSKNADAFFAKIDPFVEHKIGVMPDITKLEFSKLFDKKKGIDTVGQRHQIESCDLKGFDLLVHCLAVAQACSNNFEDVNKLRDKYLQMSFIDVLPSGFFFFKKLETGRTKGGKLLKVRQVLTKILNLRKRQVRKG